MALPVPLYVAGQPEHGDDEVTVRHPYDGRVVGRTSFASGGQVERAGRLADPRCRTA